MASKREREDKKSTDKIFLSFLFFFVLLFLLNQLIYGLAKPRYLGAVSNSAILTHLNLTAVVLTQRNTNKY
jgi:hypothetical protein